MVLCIGPLLISTISPRHEFLTQAVFQWRLKVSVTAPAASFQPETFPCADVLWHGRDYQNQSIQPPKIPDNGAVDEGLFDELLSLIELPDRLCNF